MRIFYIFIFFFFNVYRSISSECDEISDDFFRKFSDDFFLGLKKQPFLSSFGNDTFVFINGSKVFNINSENCNIESDFSVNSPRNFSLKVYDDNGKVVITITSDQCYYFKVRDSIVFIGSIKIKLIKNKIDINTDYLIYDINKDAFFNNNITTIKGDKVNIEGTKVYFKRDLSYFRILPNNITCRYRM